MTWTMTLTIYFFLTYPVVELSDYASPDYCDRILYFSTAFYVFPFLVFIMW
jgi:hypothetical protein